MGMTNALANAMLGTVFLDAAHWLALHNTDPTAAGLAGGEIDGNGYERQDVDWTDPTNRTIANNNLIIFDNLPAAEVNFFAFWTAATGGRIDYVLPVPKMTFNDGGNLIIPVSDITITFA